MRALFSIFSRFNRTLFSEGLAGVWKRVWRRLQNFISVEEEYLCLELDLTALQPRYTVRGKNLLIRPLTLEDAPALAARLGRKEMETTKKHLGRDGFGFAAFSGEKIIGHLGMKIGEYHLGHIRYRFQLGPRMVYSNGMVVDQEFRGKIVSGALLEYGLLYFKALGYTRSITITQTTNVASLNLSGHLGFREIHRIVSKRVFMIRARPRISYTGPEIPAPTAHRRVRELAKQPVLSGPAEPEQAQDSNHADG